jgi:hypothetical protein
MAYSELSAQHAVLIAVLVVLISSGLLGFLRPGEKTVLLLCAKLCVHRAYHATGDYRQQTGWTIRYRNTDLSVSIFCFIVDRAIGGSPGSRAGQTASMKVTSCPLWSASAQVERS